MTTVNAHNRPVKTAEEIYEYLDKYVVGQQDAKEAAAYVGYLHQLRVKAAKIQKEYEDHKGKLKDLDAKIARTSTVISLYHRHKESAEDRLKAFGNNPQLDVAKKNTLDYIDECEEAILNCEVNLQLCQKEKKEILAKCPPEGAITGSSSNLLLLGPSGCGKTYIISKLAECLGLPFKAVDTTTVTASGWVGDDIYDKIRSYVDEFTGKEDMEYGIIFLDEIDKICKASIGSGGTDHNKNTQESLLKLLEGTLIEAPSSGFKSLGQNMKPLNTKNILFVLAGSFNYVEEKLREVTIKNSVGFHGLESDEQKTQKKLKRNLHAFLQKHNVATELIGRISVISRLVKLTPEQLKQALTSKEGNLLERYSYLYSLAAKTLNISEKEIDKIVDECYNSEVGARGLQVALDKLLLEREFGGE